MFVYLDEKSMEQICHRVAVEFFEKDDEPISPFASVNKQNLYSALGLPASTFGGQELYKTLEVKAAVLYYSLIKNHPFPNGNKRIATASFLVFLFMNGFWLPHKTDELVEMAITIAESHRTDRDEVIKKISVFLTQYLSSV